jgi:DNA-binding transcriptional regulator/RsmH inhibitor MraZ
MPVGLQSGELEQVHGKNQIDAETEADEDAPLFSHAAKCEIDGQGRILLPQNLRASPG